MPCLVRDREQILQEIRNDVLFLEVTQAELGKIILTATPDLSKFNDLRDARTDCYPIYKSDAARLVYDKYRHRWRSSVRLKKDARKRLKESLRRITDEEQDRDRAWKTHVPPRMSENLAALHTHSRPGDRLAKVPRQ
jgi:hypothetical protein